MRAGLLSTVDCGCLQCTYRCSSRTINRIVSGLCNIWIWSENALANDERTIYQANNTINWKMYRKMSHGSVRLSGMGKSLCETSIWNKQQSALAHVSQNEILNEDLLPPRQQISKCKNIQWITQTFSLDFYAHISSFQTY